MSTFLRLLSAVAAGAIVAFGTNPAFAATTSFLSGIVTLDDRPVPGVTVATPPPFQKPCYFLPAASTLLVGSAPSQTTSAVGPYVEGTFLSSSHR